MENPLGDMNTEPVKTTQRGIAVFIAGVLGISQVTLIFVNELCKFIWHFEIPIELQQSAVALATGLAGVFSNLNSIDRLRSKVTPWDTDTGARTPGPLDYIADPVDPPGAG